MYHHLAHASHHQRRYSRTCTSSEVAKRRLQTIVAIDRQNALIDAIWPQRRCPLATAYANAHDVSYSEAATELRLLVPGVTPPELLSLCGLLPTSNGQLWAAAIDFCHNHKG